MLRSGPLPDRLTQCSDCCIHRTEVFIDAIFNLRVRIVTEEVLLLPLVGFLADVHELRREDMPSLGAPAVAKVAIEKFGLRPKMVLRQRLGVGHQR